MKRILTYGTFDLLHYGHIRILKRAKELGDYLVVALSTDEFNATKGKKAYAPFINENYVLKAQAKKDKNTTLGQTTKLKLNSSSEIKFSLFNAFINISV